MPLPERIYHPQVDNREIWPGPDGYPWKDIQANGWTREALLRRTSSGKLFASWTTGGFIEPWVGNYTMMRLSDDDGATWRKAGTFRLPGRGLFASEVFSPQDGELHAIMMVYRGDSWLTGMQNFRTISHDGGATWSDPHALPGGIPGMWPGRGIVHSTGRWIIPVSWPEQTGAEWAAPVVGASADRVSVGLRSPSRHILPEGSADADWSAAIGAWAERNFRFACGTVLSDDGGASFRLRGYLRGGLKGQLIEPRVIETADHTVVMFMRSQKDGRLWQSRSEDAGESWTEPTRTDIPNPSAKVCLLRAADGRIFLIHNPVELDDRIYGARNPLAVWVSHDDMRSWKVKVELVRDRDPDASLNYPDGFIDEARGEIALCWEDGVRVYLMRFPLDIA